MQCFPVAAQLMLPGRPMLPGLQAPLVKTQRNLKLTTKRDIEEDPAKTISTVIFSGHLIPRASSSSYSEVGRGLGLTQPCKAAVTVENERPASMSGPEIPKKHDLQWIAILRQLRRRHFRGSEGGSMVLLVSMFFASFRSN